MTDDEGVATTAVTPDEPELLDELARRWRATWPLALATWGRTSRLHAPVLHTDPCGMPSWAWYSLEDVEVHVDLTVVRERHVEDHALAVLAHEIGHHLLAPMDWASHVRIAARVQVGLIDLDHLIGLVSNLWCDLLINDRLQRQLGVDRAALSAAVGPPDENDVLMLLVLRTNEILWGLPRGALVGDHAAPDDQALLCSRLVRAYARDPVGGAAGFATLVRSTIPVEQLRAQQPSPVVACGGQSGGDGSLPFGVATDPTLAAPALHPSRDPRVVGAAFVEATTPDAEPPAAAPTAGNALTPGSLHTVLQALGSATSAEQVAIAWYRANAARHLVPFPTRPRPRRSEDLLAGLEPWEVGDDLSTVDWTGTMTASPVVVPGMTTVRRAYLDDPEDSVEVRPVDLDLYLDSSGSMPDPRRQRAPIALAGAILALSALRAGARVQATTWSGPDQVAGTDGFTRDTDAVLRAVVAYFGGSTSFPRALLRRTHLGDPAGTPPTRRGPTHIAVISDDGVETMFQERRNVLDPTAGEALRAADGGGTLVLQVPRGWAERFERRADGYAVHSVVTEDDLLTFVRRMAESTWGGDRGAST